MIDASPSNDGGNAGVGSSSDETVGAAGRPGNSGNGTDLTDTTDSSSDSGSPADNGNGIGCSKATAVNALKEYDNDLVNASCP